MLDTNFFYMEEIEDRGRKIMKINIRPAMAFLYGIFN